MSRLKQITRTFLLFLLATALVSTSLFSVPVRAEPYPSQAENQIKGTVYITSLAACMSAGTLGRSLAFAKQGAFTYDEMSSGEWFRQNTDGAFWLGYLANDDGKTPIDTGRNCSINNDGVNLLKSVYTYLGVTNPLDFLCRFPTFRVLSDPDKKTGIEGCMKATGSDKFYFSAQVETSDVLQVMGHYRSINTPSIGVLQTGQGALGYLFNWNTFAKLCRGSITPGADPNLSSVIMVTVADIDPTANLMMTKRVPYTFANGITSSTEILVGTDHNNLVSDQWVTATPIRTKCGDYSANSSSKVSLKAAGAEAYMIEVNKSIRNGETNPADIPRPGGGAGGGGSSEVTCHGGAFGWLLCPAIDGARAATTLVEGWLANGLAQPPLERQVSEDPEDPDSPKVDSVVYKAWAQIRNIANVVFFIALLVIVFSQATSIGINNYGIKRLMPRLIAAAVLVNISFFICAILVDVSNIVGDGVIAMFNTITNSSLTGAQLLGSGSGGLLGNGQDNIGGMVIAGIGAGIIVFFFLLTPILILVVVTALVVALRDAIIIILCLLAPLAFALWILPNTEKWFKKWWELYTGMLVLFPLVMLVFGACGAASEIILAQAKQAPPSANPTSVDNGLSWAMVAALIIKILPLIALPTLFKIASSALGRIQSMAQSGSQKIQSTGKSMAGKVAGNTAMGQALQQRRGIKQHVRQERGRNKLVNSGLAKFGMGKEGRSALERFEVAEDAKEVEAHRGVMQQEKWGSEQLLTAARGDNKHLAQAAMHEIQAQSMHKEMFELQDEFTKEGADPQKKKQWDAATYAQASKTLGSNPEIVKGREALGSANPAAVGAMSGTQFKRLKESEDADAKARLADFVAEYHKNPAISGNAGVDQRKYAEANPPKESGSGGAKPAVGFTQGENPPPNPPANKPIVPPGVGDNETKIPHTEQQQTSSGEDIAVRDTRGDERKGGGNFGGFS